MAFLRPRLPLFLLLLLSGLLFLLGSPVPASAQAPDLLFEEAACRDNPHSEDCICGKVRRFGYFPKEFNSDGDPEDADGDGKFPQLEDGLWVDEDGEAANAAGERDPKEKARKMTDLEFMADDRYTQRCSLAYFREDQRRLWRFAVALGAAFTVVSLIWVGVVHMQNTASGVDISKTRAMLTRVIVGIVILACAFLIWEAVNEVLFRGLDSWTLERGVFYDLR